MRLVANFSLLSILVWCNFSGPIHADEFTDAIGAKRGIVTIIGKPESNDLRRLDENAEIIMVERGPYMSYANCGLPYHVGDVIPEESDLLVASEAMFRANFNVDARTRCEAVGISPADKTVELSSDSESEEGVGWGRRLLLAAAAQVAAQLAASGLYQQGRPRGVGR